MNDELIEALARYADDPLGWVMWAFPWGEPGELEHETGPEIWQAQILVDLRDGLIDFTSAIRLARTSGHGIGKSALVSWLILWAMSTMENTIGVVTANTENQLKTKTWVQVATWYRRMICRDMFKMTKTALFSVDPEYENTWRFDMVPWSVHNTEAFAGLHNKNKRILVVFDEASAIDDLIWEVTEGALTDENTQIIWAVFGNPTKNKGRFRDCFAGGRFAARWNSAAIDSRSVRFTNKVQIAEWIADYGEDSDFVRVRVRGVFPRVDAESFISYELARQAINRDVERGNDPIILGVDVGRFGDDPSVIYPRCGRNAKDLPIEVLYGYDTMRTASKVAQVFLTHSASVVMIDSGGVGGGVVDRLRQLHIPVIEVDFGSSPDGTNPDDGAKYANKRAEIWGGMRNWLSRGGSIPERIPGVETTLVDELTAPNYGLNNNEAIQLESKKEMRRRGIKSPNVADALACTFASPVYEAPIGDDFIPAQVPSDYDPFAQERLH